MRLNRRGVFGLFGGAAIAGPKLAAEFAQDMSVPQSMSFGSIGGFPANSTGNWHLERIAKLKQLISGEDPDEKHQRRMDRLCRAETFERYRLDGLRSVSAPHKLQMLQDGEAERRRRITKLNAEFELESLLEMKIPGF